MRGSGRIGRKCAALVGATALAWALLAAPATAQSEEQLRRRTSFLARRPRWQRLTRWQLPRYSELPRTAPPPRRGGLRVPWGVVVDGNDNIWVANFAGRAVSQFCGSRAVACRPGTATGAPISPAVTGYGLDGLVRNTGITIDQAGNVWVANSWKQIPIQTNPGGSEMVAFVGAAAPVVP